MSKIHFEPPGYDMQLDGRRGPETLWSPLHKSDDLSPPPVPTSSILLEQPLQRSSVSLKLSTNFGCPPQASQDLILKRVEKASRSSH